MSGITMDGRLYRMVRDEALDSLDRVVFLKHLLPHVSDKLLAIWDGSPIHKGQVRSFLAAGGAQQIHSVIVQFLTFLIEVPLDQSRQSVRFSLGMAILTCESLPH
jgi:hypothetical protein